MEPFITRRAATAALALLLALGTGCDQQQRADLNSLDDTAAVVQSGSPRPNGRSTASSREASEQLRHESWFALYMGDAKIGHTHNREYLVQSRGESWVRVEIEQLIVLLRGQDRVEQSIRLTSIERPTGEVIRLHSEVSDGTSTIKTDATRENDELEIALITEGDKVIRSIPWKPTWRGFFAEHQVLRSEPPAPGKIYSYWSFIPVMNVAGETRLTVKDWEYVETPFGREKLLRVDSRLTAAGQTLDSVISCDANGTIRGYHTPQINITAHRTVQNLALAENDDVDLYQALSIQVSNPIPNPHESQHAIYEARLRSGKDPLHVFPSDHSQRVTLLNQDQVQIEVIAVRPEGLSLEESPQAPPTAADLSANALIQTEDPRVQALLGEIQVSGDDAWHWALACEKFVSQRIENKVLTEAFATAAEVAESRTGDCTEHAVLTAALCRANGIPTRVATGLVAYESIYAFHMWNEVWIGDRWVPIDSTLGRGGIGAGHIKLGVSNLDGVSPFAALAPVLDVMGSLELKVVSYE